MIPKLKNYICFRIVLLTLILPSLVISQPSSKNSAYYLSGTTILAVVEPDTAWLAADTKVLKTMVSTRHSEGQKGTKIFKNGNMYYGFAGISLYSTPSYVIFQPRIIIDSVLSKRKSIKESFDLLDSIFFMKVNNVANKLYQDNPIMYYDEKNSKRPLFSYILMGFEDKKPACFMVNYQIDPQGFGMSRIKRSEIISYEGGNAFFFIGHASEARRLISSGEHKLNVNNITNELACLIQTEANLDSEFVGMPVQEYIIYNDNSTFLDNLECSNP